MKRTYAQNPDSGFFERYLEILGIQKRKPSMEALEEILISHLSRIPFENISKLYFYRKNGIPYFPNHEQYLDGIEHYNYGGTCYTNNYYLYLLLDHLGYDIRLCGADMNSPDVHVVSFVRLDKKEYIVDVGYASPFYEPLPRDLKSDFEISMGKMMYRIKPKDPKGKTRVERYYDGRFLHGYTAKPDPREIDFFAPAIEDSFSESSTFMRNILLVKSNRGKWHRLENMKYSITENDTESLTFLSDKSEAAAVIERDFGIPAEIVSGVLEKISISGEFRG